MDDGGWTMGYRPSSIVQKAALYQHRASYAIMDRHPAAGTARNFIHFIYVRPVDMTSFGTTPQPSDPLPPSPAHLAEHPPSGSRPRVRRLLVGTTMLVLILAFLWPMPLHLTNELVSKGSNDLWQQLWN